MTAPILHFRELGQHQRSNGSLFIFHGLFGSSDNWQTIAKTLAEHFHVVLADMRNHGRSFHANSMSYADMASDMRHLIEHLQPLRTVVIGHSMGGKAAMQLAANFFDVPQGLVVIDIAPRAYPPHHQHVIAALNAIPLDTLQSRQEAETILTNHGIDLSTRQFLLKSLYRTENNRFAWRFNLPVITQQIIQVGQGLTSKQPITTPTLFIRGSRSPYITNQDIEQIATLFPNSQLVTIQNAGHWVHAEQPAALTQALLAFLQEEL
ncbi:MAG: alpha/beta fold hydrolase [Cytophagales bacterium]|nr:alpha/beta fold hydrolase [Bernardetiaceae bacterium]MDW8204534.1 alpha/beta fold hydrolase [Cytophagales bacterium]